MSDERAAPAAPPSDLQAEADKVLQYIISEMALSPSRALAVCMTAAAMIVASADEVPALVGQTKAQAIADFGEMIDILTAARDLEDQPPKGTA